MEAPIHGCPTGYCKNQTTDNVVEPCFLVVIAEQLLYEQFTSLQVCFCQLLGIISN